MSAPPVTVPGLSWAESYALYEQIAGAAPAESESAEMVRERPSRQSRVCYCEACTFRALGSSFLFR